MYVRRKPSRDTGLVVFSRTERSAIFWGQHRTLQFADWRLNQSHLPCSQKHQAELLGKKKKKVFLYLNVDGVLCYFQVVCVPSNGSCSSMCLAWSMFCVDFWALQSTLILLLFLRDVVRGENEPLVQVELKDKEQKCWIVLLSASDSWNKNTRTLLDI